MRVWPHKYWPESMDDTLWICLLIIEKKKKSDYQISFIIIRNMMSVKQFYLDTIALLSFLTLPSVNKGIHGFAPQICDSATLLSLSVRPVRFVPVPCRITNLRRKTPSDPKCLLLVAGKATE